MTKPTEMQRAEAAQAIIGAQHGPGQPYDTKEAEVAAFMAIFHPEHVLPRGQRYTDKPRRP